MVCYQLPWPEAQDESWNRWWRAVRFFDVKMNASVATNAGDALVDDTQGDGYD